MKSLIQKIGTFFRSNGSETEKRFRLAQQIARVGSFDLDMDTGISYWSPEVAAMHGFPARKMKMNRSFWKEHLYLGDLEKADEEIRQAIETLKPFETEWRVKWPDGSIHWLTGRFQAFKDDKTGKTRILGVNIDITERKKFEIERQRFEMLAEASTEFIAMCDTQFRPTYINPSGLKMVGLSTKDLGSNYQVADFLFAEDRNLFFEDFMPRVARDGQGEIEIRFRHFETGEEIWFICNVFSLRDESEACAGWATVSRNISERKKNEDALRKSEARFRTIFEHAAVGVALINGATGEFVRINKRYAEIFGFTRNDILSSKIHELTSLLRSDIAQKNLHSLQVGELSEFCVECEYLRNDGAEGWVNLTVSLADELDGEANYLIAIAEDTTEKRRAKDILARSNSELEKLVSERTVELKSIADDLARSNADLERFAYLATHDLQEPLRRISIYVGLFNEKYQHALDDTGVKYLDYITDGARRMSTLIYDLLAYSRIGRSDAVIEDVPINDVLIELLRDHEHTIRNHEARFEITDMPLAKLPRAELYQLFGNLIGNALKFHRPGTQLVISIRAIKLESEWEFVVSDSGIGIESEFLEEIFILFKRLHSRAEFPGTGIGLAICKKIIDKHGGKIWATSVVDEGSNFHFSLPRELFGV